LLVPGFASRIRQLAEKTGFKGIALQVEGLTNAGFQTIHANLRYFGYITFPSFFQGGVAGTADFGMFTILLSRPGWLMFCFILIFFLQDSLTLIDSIKRIQLKRTYCSEFNQPPRPDNIYFCKSDDFCVWPPLLEKRRGNLFTYNPDNYSIFRYQDIYQVDIYGLKCLEFIKLPV